MRPGEKDSDIEIPITLDVSSPQRVFKPEFFTVSVLALSLWFIYFVIALIVAETNVTRFWLPLILFFVVFYGCRYGIMSEQYYRNRRKAVTEHHGIFGHDYFWNANDIVEDTITVYMHPNNYKSIVIAFDKGVIVGKNDDTGYHHFEGLAEAYKYANKKGIEFTHIDYMNLVGKDTRLNRLREDVESTEHKDLRTIVSQMLEGVQLDMNSAYASYDVYVFTFKISIDRFFGLLQNLLPLFKKANYVRYRYLNTAGVRDVVKAVFNLEEFSVSMATFGVASVSNGMHHYLKPLWVEADGKRVILNKSRQDLKSEEGVRQAELHASKTKKGKHLFKRTENDDIIDLFNK